VKPVIIFAGICSLLLAHATDGRPARKTVVVAVLDNLSPADAEQMDQFLWNQVASRKEAGNFPSASTSKWKEKYKRFADTLVDKAAEQKLDSVALRKVLDLIFDHSKGEIAYLPVAAYHTTMVDRPIWIVTVRWEYPLINRRPTQFYHVRVFAFDEQALTQVAYITCG